MVRNPKDEWRRVKKGEYRWSSRVEDEFVPVGGGRGTQECVPLVTLGRH